ncbi:hypothetical protein BJY52DRAFT_1254746 [Lactarius psammicola]|nr:hypothetical protein BJY52DRAFT_1254746 [Lactarius psammicola]
MSSFNLFPGLSSVTNIVPASGLFPTNVFNQKPAEGSQTPGLLSQATGLLSQTPDLLSGGALDWATPKPPILIFAILLRLLSLVRGFIPPFALSLLLLCIPPFVSFYELTIRRILPQLPSMFTIAFKLYKNGVLTMSTVTWLVSSLPQSMIGGLSAFGGVAMGGTAALAGGATALVGGATAGASAVVGGVAGLAGDAAKTVTQGINHLNPITMATDIGGATKGIAEGISLIQSGEIEVAQNIAHLLSEQGTAAGRALIPTVAEDVAQEVIQATIGNTSAVAKDAIQAAMGTTNAIAGAAIHPVAAIGNTQAAVTESATKLAHALDSVNPLSNLIPNPQQGVLGNMLRPKLPGLA